jgi:hypothetical protein
MTLTIDIPNQNIADKIFNFLENFKSDGVEITKLENNKQKILNDIKEGIEDIKNRKTYPIETLWDKLND